ncbi:hypothetical protein ACYATM_02735 [Lactobacillaceae bacterium Scapto_B20]
MEIDTQNFIDQVTDEQFKSTYFTTQKADLEKDIQSAVQPMVDFIVQQIQANQIAQARLLIEDADAELKLETSIINLPLRYVKAISKIMTGEGVQPLNVYMTIESPAINRSSLRIDKVASADAFATDANSMTEKIKPWVQEQLAKIDANLAAGAEEEAEAKTD